MWIIYVCVRVAVKCDSWHKRGIRVLFSASVTSVTAALQLCILPRIYFIGIVTEILEFWKTHCICVIRLTYFSIFTTVQRSSNFLHISCVVPSHECRNASVLLASLLSVVPSVSKKWQILSFCFPQCFTRFLNCNVIFPWKCMSYTVV
jgi:hypothetical protein